MSGSEPAEERAKLRAALLRSMPITRMLDYGMDYWDATRLANAPVEQHWAEAAALLAETQTGRAEAAVERGDVETAVSCYRRATAALIFAQMAYNSDTEPKRALYSRLGATYQAAAELDVQLRIERLSVPLRNTHCNAWLVRPRDTTRSPAVVIVGGQSGWGPAFHRQAEALARRGLTAVLLEAPGQGESRMFSGLHLDQRVAEAFSSTLDVVQELTGHRGLFGVWGNSLGGLFAAHAALKDDRFGACCVNGAPSAPVASSFRTANEQSKALLGVETDDEVTAAFQRLWVDPAADRMRAALLVLHGGADPLITLDQQRVFLELSERSTLRVWEDGEHTIYNHSEERTDLVCDWFRAQLSWT